METKKNYCIGIDAIKEYGIKRWHEEFFMPFSMEDFNTFSDILYNTLKKILASNISQFSKDALYISNHTISKYAHSLFKFILTSHLAKENYNILNSEKSDPFGRFDEEALKGMVRRKRYEYAKSTLLNVMSVPPLIAGYRKSLNIGGSRERFKRLYAKRNKFYLNHKPIYKLLKLEDALNRKIMDEYRYIIDAFYYAGRNILHHFKVSRNYERFLKETTNNIGNDLLFLMKLYSGTKRHVQSIDCDYILATSLGNILNRIIMKAFQANDKTVIGFSHGNLTGTAYDKTLLLFDLSVVDKYITDTEGQKKFFENLLDINTDLPLAKRPKIESGENDFIYKIYKNEKKKPPAKFRRKLMLIEPPINQPFPIYHSALYYPLQLDLTLRIMKILKEYGYYVIMKLRPARLKESERGRIYSRFADECITGRFEQTYNAADTLVFPHWLSTTFGFSLATNKRVIYFLYEPQKYIQGKLELLNKRCTAVACWFDDDNRIRFYEDDLLDAMKKEQTQIDTEFLKAQMFPKKIKV